MPHCCQFWAENASSLQVKEMRAKHATQQEHIENFHKSAEIAFQMLKRTSGVIADLTREHEEQRLAEQFPLRAIPESIEPRVILPSAPSNSNDLLD